MAATKTYGESVLPSDVVKVFAGDTIDVSIGFNATLGLIGNMDTANGSASTGTVETVDSISQGRQLFGENSEMAQQIEMAYANGVASIEAIAVGETSVTETFGDGTTTVSSGTLTADPVDPRVLPEHTVDVQDTTEGASVTVNYVDVAPSSPSEANTVNLNLQTGEWVADSASVYEFTFDTADFESAISTMAPKNVRYICALTEDEGVAQTLLSELSARASQFDFKRGVVNAPVNIQPSEIDGFTYSVSDQRMVSVVPARGTSGADDQTVRTAGAVAGLLTSRPLGEATFGWNHGGLNGLTDLAINYSNGDLATLADEKGLMPLKFGRNIHIAKDMTTSTADAFKRVYKCEIVDEAAEISHLICEEFIADTLTEETLEDIEANHRTAFTDMANDNPPLLDEFLVNATEGASQNEVDVEIGLDVIDVIDRIEVSVNVGAVRQQAEISAVATES